MYPGLHAVARADQPAVVMAGSGETVTYRELEARSNRLAHLLRAVGLKRLDHYAIFMENHPRFFDCCAAGERSGLYFTCRQFLPDGRRTRLYRQQQPFQGAHHVAGEARNRARGPGRLPRCRTLPDRRTGPGMETGCSTSTMRQGAFRRRRSRTSRSAGRCSIPRARRGNRRACCVLCPISRRRKWRLIGTALSRFWRIREGQIYLSPAPLYHSAPFAGAGLTDQERRNGHRHGAVRRGAFPAARRTVSRDLHAARPDHVLTHAEAARSRAPPLRSFVAGGGASRRGPLSRAGQARDDRLVGADHRSNTTPRPKGWAWRFVTAPNGSPIRARSAGRCSANCMSSTSRCEKFRSARPASCGSKPRRHSNISTIPPRPRRRTRPTVR